MKEPDWENCSEKEMWEYVAIHLARVGVETVMVGGSVVSVYTNGLYQSGDIDLVKSGSSREEIAAALAEIGFQKHGRLFKHPECEHLYLDFPAGPVSIGDDYHIQPRAVKKEGVVIKILSPTDCVKDRLASYLYFQARECLDQAVMVAQKQQVNAREVKRWCEKEGRPQVFVEWQRLLKGVN